MGRTHSFDVLVCDGRIKGMQIFYSINDLTDLYHINVEKNSTPLQINVPQQIDHGGGFVLSTT